MFLSVFFVFKGRSGADMKLIRSAPAFELPTLDGKVFRLKSMIGSPVVINFWASWCGPCREEAPVMQRAYAKFKKSGVKFIAIAVDDDIKSVRRFMKEYNWSLPVSMLDKEDIANAYGVYGLPKTVVVDKAGIISFERLGAISEEELSAQIRSVLPK